MVTRKAELVVVAGVDVHQSLYEVCLLERRGGARTKVESRSFGTMAGDIAELKAWLQKRGCTHIGMEATGVYWRPLHTALEDAMSVLVANPVHVKVMRGHKTDRKDAEWIARKVLDGEFRNSFIPSAPFRELRDWVRFRKQLIEARTSIRNSTTQLLEQAGVKLASALSNIYGVSGMDMLRAISTGECDPKALASLARMRAKHKKPLIEAACAAQLSPAQQGMLAQQLERLDQLEEKLAHVEQQIEQGLVPYAEQVRRLRKIPGVDRQTIAVVIGELGVDLSAFPNAQKLASWVGLCPGSNQSAGRQKSSRCRHGNPYLRWVLMEAALGAARTKGSWFKSVFHRLCARRGYKRAAIAIAHKLLVVIYKMLTTGGEYQEHETSAEQIKHRQRESKHLLRRLKELGYNVQLVENPTIDPAPC
jgi:transposase